MTSTISFPYYLALFGLSFFILVICCCVKLIDIIERPRTTRLNMPAWNYSGYNQSSPVAVLNPHPPPEALLRYTELAESHGMSVEEYLHSIGRPGLYPSTPRNLISATAAAVAQPAASLFTIVVPEARSRLNSLSAAALTATTCHVDMVPPPPAHTTPTTPTAQAPNSPANGDLPIRRSLRGSTRSTRSTRSANYPSQDVCFDV